MKQNRVKIGLIGCGGMGKNHLQALNLFPEVDITAICDPYQPNMDLALGILDRNVALFEDYNECLKKGDFEAVVIATPTFTHKNIILAAIAAGKHILLEKPLAPNVQSCIDILEAQKNSSNILQMGTQSRFSPPLRKIKEMLMNGIVGAPVIAQFNEHRRPFYKKVDDWIVDSKKSGGALVEKNVHHFDIFNWLMGCGVKSVYASGSQGGCYNDGNIPADARFSDGSSSNIIDNALVVVEYDNGCRFGLSLCLFSFNVHGLWLMGTKGRIETERGSDTVTMYDLSAGTSYKKEHCPTVSYNLPVNPLYKERTPHGGLEFLSHQYFVRSIRNEVPNWPPLEEGYLATMVALAAEESIRSGAVIDFKKFDTQNVSPKFNMPQYKEYDLSGLIPSVDKVKLNKDIHGY